MAKRERKSYSEAQRKQILATAISEKLTADQVRKKFGVKNVTYYSWRKKAGIKGPRGRKPAVMSFSGKAAGGKAAGVGLNAQVRAGVQAKVREVLPGIVREEVSNYLNVLFGAGGGKSRRNLR
ncbi:MAG: transposase [Candidatus Eisenbacteria bacterium]|nr:transposase [Candidatus Eisenbacteria bacterium]